MCSAECGPGQPPPVNSRQRKIMRSYLRRKAHLEHNCLSSDSGAEAAREASPVPSYVEAPEEEDRELTPEPGPPAAVCGRKRTHWEKHYPWRFVTPRALNTRGERIFYRVDDDQDRKWAWRLERALDHHRAVHEGDMDERSDMYVKELKELSHGGLLRWRLERINELEARIVQLHKNFNNGVGYGL